jgi:hypothetical protein
VFVVPVFLLAAFVLGPWSNSAIAKEEVIDYSKVVEIHKVDVLDGVRTAKPGKRRSKKDSRRKTLEITFSANADVPKGAIILFELEYRGLPFGQPKKFKLKTDNRNNLKLLWSPKFRLPVDEYYLWSKMPMEFQSKSVRQAIKKKKTSFPESWEPWGTYHLELPFKVGSEADAKAERREIKDYFRKGCDVLIGLNGDFLDLCDEVEAGDKHVNGGKVDLGAFSKDVTAWMKKMAEVQKSIFRFLEKEPGLYKKAEGAHIELGNLSKMVAKRCLRVKLKETLEKYEFKISDLKVPGIEGLDPNVRGRVNVRDLKRKYDRVAQLSGFAEDIAAEEAAEDEATGDDAETDDGATDE